MSGQPVRVERSEVHASGDAAEIMFKNNYADFRPKGSTEELKFDIRRTAVGELMLDHTDFSMPVSLVNDPLSHLYL